MYLFITPIGKSAKTKTANVIFEVNQAISLTPSEFVSTE